MGFEGYVYCLTSYFYRQNAPMFGCSTSPSRHARASTSDVTNTCRRVIFYEADSGGGGVAFGECTRHYSWGIVVGVLSERIFFSISIHSVMMCLRIVASGYRYKEKKRKQKKYK